MKAVFKLLFWILIALANMGIIYIAGSIVIPILYLQLLYYSFFYYIYGIPSKTQNQNETNKEENKATA